MELSLVITQHYRFFEICFRKNLCMTVRKNLMRGAHLSFDVSVVSEAALSSRSVTT